MRQRRSHENYDNRFVRLVLSIDCYKMRNLLNKLKSNTGTNNVRNVSKSNRTIKENESI